MRRRFTLLVLASYLLAGLVAYLPDFPADRHRLFGQANGDPAQTVWLLAWTAHAITTGHNPLFTSAVNVPAGMNLAQAASMPLLGLIALPLTVTLGAVASANALMILAMPLSAAAAYAVFVRWRLWPRAAALAGLLYGFSPYTIVQAQTHLNLAFVPLPPLIVAVVVDIVRRPDHPWRRGSVLGILVVAQYLIGSEILALTAIGCVAGVSITAVRLSIHGTEIELEKFRGVGTALLAASFISLLALSYPIWLQLAGPSHYSGPPWSVHNAWHADVADIVAPTPLQAFRPILDGTGKSLSVLAGDEDGAYLGAPVVGLLLILVWRSRRSRPVVLAAALGLVAVVLSFGPRLVINNWHSPVPLPFSLVTHWPVLDQILPIRFAFITAACTAGIVAFSLDYQHRQTKRPVHDQWYREALSAAPVSLLFTTVVLLASWAPSWPYSSQTVAYVPANLSRQLSSGDPIVLAYPYPEAPEDRAFVWQEQASFGFRLLGVYGVVPGPTDRPTWAPPLLTPSVPQEFLIEAELGAQSPYPSAPGVGQVELETRQLITEQAVEAVLVDISAQGGAEVAAMFQAALGIPFESSGSFELWKPSRATGLSSIAPPSEAPAGLGRRAS